MLSVVCCITVPLFTSCCVLHVHLSIYISFFSSLQGHHGQGSQPLRKIRESGKMTFDFSSQGKSQGIWEQMHTSGESTSIMWKSGNLICLTALLDVKVLLRSHQNHIGSTALMAVCVCVCVIWVVNESQIPMSTFCGATHHLVPTHHLAPTHHLVSTHHLSPTYHLPPTHHLSPTHHLGSVVSSLPLLLTLFAAQLSL